MLDRARPLKRLEVTDGLRTWISQQAPGDRLPPVTELTEHFGVSAATIVGALEQLQKEGRVLRRHGAGNFVSAPKSARAKGLVAVLSYATEPSAFVLSVLQAIEKELRSQRRAPLLIIGDDETQRYQLTQERWEQGEIEGFLHVGSLLHGTVPAECPGVVVGEAPEGALVNQVALDNEGAGKQVGEHLWGLGHRRVAFISSERMRVITQTRYLGICQTWQRREASLSPTSLTYLHRPRTLIAWEEFLAPCLEGLEPVTALVAVNDNLAAMLVVVLEKLGYRVPEDISIVGFDDSDPLALPFGPGLTTIRYSPAALGTLGVQLLRDAIAAPQNAPRHLRLPVELIVRESTGPPPSSLSWKAKTNTSRQ